MSTTTRARIIAALSTIMLLLLPLLAGCSSSNSTQSSNTTATSPSQSNNGSNPAPSSSGDLDEILITYYSFSGNTEKVAEKLHERSPDADMFKIEPAEPYGSYSEAAVRAKKEHDENARPTGRWHGWGSTISTYISSTSRTATITVRGTRWRNCWAKAA
ncbi:flavodoxin [Bifidobacterium felsineum]|uniref:flavodoxin n=1 Tax=Bifidobacterium felsineum TaxID=2045440 RepID=UPI001BDC8BF9|nr:hypothetical protein [Bifidobacterium felsineum]MBT1163656.1 hypothetical protein [Bifidobacterium felsineum]